MRVCVATAQIQKTEIYLLTLPGHPRGGVFYESKPGKTTPWVFTKGTGEPPGKPVPSFYPFRHNASSTADASGGAVAGGRRWRCFTPFEPPPASCFDPGGTPPSARFLPSRAEDSGVPPFSSGAIPVRLEISMAAARWQGDGGPGSVAPQNHQTEVRSPPHDSPPIPLIGGKAGRGDGAFSPVAPGRRRRGFSKLPTLRRRLVIPSPDTQSPWDAEALVLECHTRASQQNTAPSLIVRRGGIPGFPPGPDMLEGRACCPPERFPRHRWLRASQSSRMAWPVAGDSTRREIRR